MESSLTRLVCPFRARYSVFTTLQETSFRATSCLHGPELIGIDQSGFVPLYNSITDALERRFLPQIDIIPTSNSDLSLRLLGS